MSARELKIFKMVMVLMVTVGIGLIVELLTTDRYGERWISRCAQERPLDDCLKDAERLKAL
jgi:hypothetical protein